MCSTLTQPPVWLTRCAFIVSVFFLKFPVQFSWILFRFVCIVQFTTAVTLYCALYCKALQHFRETVCNCGQEEQPFVRRKASKEPKSARRAFNWDWLGGKSFYDLCFWKQWAEHLILYVYMYKMRLFNLFWTRDTWNFKGPSHNPHMEPQDGSCLDQQ